MVNQILPVFVKRFRAGLVASSSEPLLVLLLVVGVKNLFTGKIQTLWISRFSFAEFTVEYKITSALW